MKFLNLGVVDGARLSCSRTPIRHDNSSLVFALVLKEIESTLKRLKIEIDYPYDIIRLETSTFKAFKFKLKELRASWMWERSSLGNFLRTIRGFLLDFRDQCFQMDLNEEDMENEEFIFLQAREKELSKNNYLYFFFWHVDEQGEEEGKLETFLTASHKEVRDLAVTFLRKKK